jgi:hypothetical protein
LRDETEQVIRAWHAHEIARGGQPVIDYDCAPTDSPVMPATSRLDVHARLTQLHAQADAASDAPVATVLRGHLAYLSSVLGERSDLSTYLLDTQGCPAAGWDEGYVLEIGDRARAALADHGVSWGPDTDDAFTKVQEPIDITEAREQVVSVAAELEPAIRSQADTSAPYTVTVEVADVDDYWAYWLDGAGSDVRLRFNTRQAVFTRNGLRQFALHEILGHALQSASMAEVCAREDVPWVRLLSVNLPYQVMFEGLAQAMPLFLTPDDSLLVTKVRLDHYLQLVRAELHQAINAGHTIAECVDHARARVPFWTSGAIGDALSDRGKEPLLRSYLWAYPAGIDWWVSLADTADAQTTGSVLRAAYRRPLTPADLADLWPSGPRIGGPGTTLRLRKPALP